MNRARTEGRVRAEALERPPCESPHGPHVQILGSCYGVFI